MAIRYHLDENVDHAVAQGLRSRGIDATTTIEAGLSAAADEAHLAYANAENRVIVTHDADFLRLHAAGAEHSGIVFCASPARTASQLISMLVLMHDCCEAEELRGKVEYI
ncbi:MAG: hypothetical protein DWQ29_10765 [Planctomycetota bacterium]|nr:MAG: hypothetical protein DWQ29_10765 [Planctomycetota bacterium]REK20604.1 MAG: hypothetical protein DWQ41_24685 [Planctomycetota bacterium]